MRLLVAEVAAASPLSSASSECNSNSCRWKPYSNSTDFQANASTDDNDHKSDLEADSSFTIPTPTLVYSSDLELAGAEAECAICLSEFEQGESIQVLEKCHHGFHVKCIHKWLSSRSSCPTCRTSIFLQSTLDSTPSTEAPSTN
ncbi:hypothetical protein Bca52824_054443 [Brassica carinata]|uniref:RING-type E3 ubiquitin transferase n=1 Tax=Brassica carinata TaxID=52824 RepID=A0A8X7R5T0_BRACI|nr:hypothetical protein Bca52824_054443 [Brassica carinata]